MSIKTQNRIISKDPNEDELCSKRGKRCAYSFEYPARFSPSALKVCLEQAIAPNDKQKGEKKYFVDHLEGAFLNEVENRLYIFFTRGKESSYFRKYPFVLENSIRKWKPRTKSFDSSVPPNDEDEFECWDFRNSNKVEKLRQFAKRAFLPDEDEPEEPEEEIQQSKLKEKQARKFKEKDQRNSPIFPEDEDKFALEMYSRISKGETFNSIFRQILGIPDFIALRRFNRMSEELRNLEYNLKEALNSAVQE